MASTTIKTEICSFSEYRVYPGHGVRFVSKDGKVHLFLNAKTASLSHQHIKPVKLTWTQAWRRFNKKMHLTEGTSKRRTRRTARVQKAIVGMTLEDMKHKQATIKKAVPGAKAAALREARARQAAKQETSKPAQGAAGARAQKTEKVKAARVQSRNVTTSKQMTAGRR